ncbi:MAG TPA: hypothetical protein VNK04_06825 [Gemmataceae bacterium]|nr:hypothetical protein [Gemmataceae bacterium]
MTVSTNKPPLERAVGSCVSALRRIAAYELEEPIQKRLLELSENKEFLKKAEREELMALIDFWQKRTIEKLEAQVALKLLGQVFPDLVSPK